MPWAPPPICAVNVFVCLSRTDSLFINFCQVCCASIPVWYLVFVTIMSCSGLIILLDVDCDRTCQTLWSPVFVTWCTVLGHLQLLYLAPAPFLHICLCTFKLYVCLNLNLNLKFENSVECHVFFHDLFFLSQFIAVCYPGRKTKVG